MRENHLFRWFNVLFIISFLFLTLTDGKGFGGGRGGGGFKGGSRGGSSKGAGTFGGPSSYNRVNSPGSYNSMNKPSGSSFKKNAMSFGAGALGGVAAYSMMRSMSSSYHARPGYYEPGYGRGETCVNNEEYNGTRFGRFRCPLNGFPYEATSCCGSYGEQYCCIPERNTNSGMRGSSHFGWVLLIILICLILIFLFAKHRRQRQKDIIMVPVEPPMDEQQCPPFYQPPPPPMGYPPPPMGYPPPPMGYPPPPMGYPPPNSNPYPVPPQNYDGSYNPYAQQQHQMPYPPQQQSFNPYQVKEGGPPTYNDVMVNNQGMPLTKPI